MDIRQSYKKVITDKYGLKTYECINKFQATTSQISIINLDIKFMTKCRTTGIIPIHCKLGGRRDASPQTRKILRKAEGKLLNRSIAKSHTRRWRVQQMNKKVESKLEEVLNILDYCNMTNMTQNMVKNKLKFQEQKLNQKFEKLIRKEVKENYSVTKSEVDEHQKRTLMNYSDVQVPKEFIPLLSKGLDFKIASKQFAKLDIISGIESAIKSFNNRARANEYRFECMKILRKGRNKKDNNTNEKMCNGIKLWLKQNELILIENDKGRATCIIEKQKKDELVNNELSNTERYKKLDNDKLETIRAEVNKELALLLKKKHITTEERNELRQITPVTPKARPTLKTHKDPLKIRLIINTQGSSVYKISKRVAKELKALTTSGKSYIKDTEQLVSTIKNEKLDKNESMISFDISDMYPSLPKSEVLQEIERRIRKRSFKPKLKKTALIKLSQIAVKYMTFEINNEFYDQADGLFIGSPCSSCFAEIFIQRLEEVSIYNMIHAPRLWLRKVDDTFTISKHSMDETLKELNTIHPKVKFTAESEEDGKLAFLDCNIIRKEDNTLKTKVYRKATHTGQYINFESNQPLPVKLSVIQTLTKRAKTVCIENNDLNEELNYIQKTMELNNYPPSLVRRTIKSTISNRPKKKPPNEENEIVAYIPYEIGISEKLKSLSNRFNVKLRFTRNKALKQKVNNHEHNVKIDKLKEQGVVYKVNCKKCDLMYIGETGRKLNIRLNEHKNWKDQCKSLSGLSEHIKSTKHNVDWKNVEIICKEQNRPKRKFKEAIAIKKSSGQLMNKKEEMRSLSFIWDSVL